MITYTYTYEDIDTDALTATDLRVDAAEYPDAQAYRIHIEGAAQAAQALIVPSLDRIGIAWGSDATWADVYSDIEEAIDCYLNRPDEWDARN